MGHTEVKEVTYLNGGRVEVGGRLYRRVPKGAGPVEVVEHQGTYTVYDAEGECAGRVCEETGRALIGSRFWRALAPGEGW